MNLLKPPSPSIEVTGSYFFYQSRHRKDAIAGVMRIIRSSTRPPEKFMAGLSEVDDMIVEWTVETVIQGAVLREYHHWETDTIDYFKAMHDRNGSSAPSKKQDRRAHTEWVKDQLVS